MVRFSPIIIFIYKIEVIEESSLQENKKRGHNFDYFFSNQNHAHAKRAVETVKHQ